MRQPIAQYIRKLFKQRYSFVDKKYPLRHDCQYFVLLQLLMNPGIYFERSQLAAHMPFAASDRAIGHALDSLAQEPCVKNTGWLRDTITALGFEPSPANLERAAPVLKILSGHEEIPRKMLFPQGPGKIHSGSLRAFDDVSVLEEQVLYPLVYDSTYPSVLVPPAKKSISYFEVDTDPQLNRWAQRQGFLHRFFSPIRLEYFLTERPRRSESQAVPVASHGTTPSFEATHETSVEQLFLSQKYSDPVNRLYILGPVSQSAVHYATARCVTLATHHDLARFLFSFPKNSSAAAAPTIREWNELIHTRGLCTYVVLDILRERCRQLNRT